MDSGQGRLDAFTDAAFAFAVTLMVAGTGAFDRDAAFSRSSGSLAANCHATAAAERTSTTESRPKPISAAEDACRPAAIATTPSITL